MADIEKVKKDIEYAKELLKYRPEKDTVDYKVWETLDDALKALKEQETEIRQLKLALDIAKGTCKGIVFETDEKFMGDL